MLTNVLVDTTFCAGPSFSAGCSLSLSLSLSPLMPPSCWGDAWPCPRPRQHLTNGMYASVACLCRALLFSSRLFVTNDRPSSSQRPPLPLLRAFDDDWKAFRARGRERSSDSPSDLEATRLATELFGVSTPLPVSGNSTVVGRVGGCEVVLARRVGPGEVVKQLHLLPVSQR